MINCEVLIFGYFETNKNKQVLSLRRLRDLVNDLKEFFYLENVEIVRIDDNWESIHKCTENWSNLLELGMNYIYKIAEIPDFIHEMISEKVPKELSATYHQFWITRK